MAKHLKDYTYHKELMDQLTDQQAEAVRRQASSEFTPRDIAWNRLCYIGGAAAIGGWIMGAHVSAPGKESWYPADYALNHNVVRHHGDISLIGLGLTVLSTGAQFRGARQRYMRIEELAEAVIETNPRQPFAANSIELLDGSYPIDPNAYIPEDFAQPFTDSSEA